VAAAAKAVPAAKGSTRGTTFVPVKLAALEKKLLHDKSRACVIKRYLLLLISNFKKYLDA
jgi:hypothetical protein